MKWFKRLFRNERQDPRVLYNHNDDRSYQENSDILAGLEFYVTLQIRTPLSVGV